MDQKLNPKCDTCFEKSPKLIHESSWSRSNIGFLIGTERNLRILQSTYLSDSERLLIYKLTNNVRTFLAVNFSLFTALQAYYSAIVLPCGRHTTHSKINRMFFPKLRHVM